MILCRISKIYFCIVILFSLVACSASSTSTKVKQLSSYTHQVNWQKDINTGIERYYSQLSPYLIYDTLFVANRLGHVYALEPLTGRQLWDTSLEFFFKREGIVDYKDLKVSAGISAGYQKIFVGMESGLLVALDAKNGQVLWYVNAETELFSNPFVADNKIFVNSSSGDVIAFDVDDGHIIWKQKLLTSSLSVRGYSGIARTQGAIFLGTSDGKLMGFSEDNGVPVWNMPISKSMSDNVLERIIDINATPFILGHDIFVVGYKNNFYSINLKNGQINWSRNYASNRDFVVDAGSIFMVGLQGELIALDRRNGQELWVNQEFKGEKFSSPVIVNDKIILGNEDGRLYVFSYENGHFLGVVDLHKGGIYVAPFVQNEQLWVQTRKGYIINVTIM